MGFLNLVAATFDLLAWPLITLVYPLYASVGAIERNSLADNRQWLMYWVLCGLIMLFELLSSRLIECIPFWLHVKVAITLWLVFPYFGGAVYAYDRFVRPCLVFNPRSFGYWLRSKQGDSRIPNSGDFLLLVERYVQEKGSEALEELIFGKAKHVEPALSRALNNSLASMNNKEPEASKNKLLESSLGQTEYKAIASSDNKASTNAEVVSGGSELPQSSIPSKDQMEWTCELCQVCAPSEAVLHNHFQGKKHKTKERELMESTVVRIDDKAVTATETKSTEGAEVAGAVYEQPESSPNQDKTQKEWTCALCQICTHSEDSLENHLQGKVHKAKEKILTESTFAQIDESKVPVTENNPTTIAEVVADIRVHPGSSSFIPDIIQKEWTCALCQVCAQSEDSLQYHLQGEAHKAKEKKTMVFMLAQTKDKAVPAIENKSTITAEVVRPRSSSSIPDITNLEWNCALCQLRMASEASLQYHLQGKKHKAKENELMDLTRTDNKAVAATENKSTGAVVASGVCERTGSSSVADKPQNNWYCALCQLSTQSEASLQTHLCGQKHKAKEEELNAGKPKVTPVKHVPSPIPKVTRVKKSENVADRGTKIGNQCGRTGSSSVAGKPQSKWYCALCQLSTQSEASLQTHLRGKKHKDKEEELNAGKPKVTPVEHVPSPIPKVTHVKKSENVADRGTEIGNQWEQTNPNTKPTTELSAFWCDKCKLQCNSLSMLNEHLGGKRHLWCDKCKLQCNSLSMLNDHLRGKQHLWCDKCKLQCNSLSMLNDHLQGKQHLWCDKCKLQCNSLSMLTDHLSGKRHLGQE